MENSTVPLITAITILGIITLLFFVNEFFRRYKVVKKRKLRRRRRVQKLQPTIQDVENAINLQLKQWEKEYDEKHKNIITSWKEIAKRKQPKQVQP